MTRVVVCCGAGGVGKTTTSAALALRFAKDGNRVAVITIDPARRLADCLGLSTLDNQPVRVDLSALSVSEGGRLDALMLDAKQTFDALVMRLVPDVDRAQRLLDSRYYRYVSTHLVGVHEYMAMERVTALVDESDYDIVVLDTPPTRHAVSFLTAPERMIAVMDERVLGALAKARSPRGYQTLQRSAELVMSVLDKMAGAATLREIGEFMGAIQEMGLSFRERADRTRALLRGPSAYFLIVTTAAATARFEAIELLGFLDAFGFQVGGIVLNRCVFPPSCGLSPSTGDLVRPDGVSAADWQAALDIVSQAPDHFHALARADAVAIEQLHADTSHNCKLFTVPRLADEIHDLSSLDRMAQWLPLPGDLDHGPDPET